jgi:hypothetical protein
MVTMARFGGQAQGYQAMIRMVEIPEVNGLLAAQSRKDDQGCIKHRYTNQKDGDKPGLAAQKSIRCISNRQGSQAKAEELRTRIPKKKRAGAEL